MGQFSRPCLRPMSNLALPLQYWAIKKKVFQGNLTFPLQNIYCETGNIDFSVVNRSSTPGLKFSSRPVSNIGPARPVLARWSESSRFVPVSEASKNVCEFWACHRSQRICQNFQKVRKYQRIWSRKHFFIKNLLQFFRSNHFLSKNIARRSLRIYIPCNIEPISLSSFLHFS